MLCPICGRFCKCSVTSTTQTLASNPAANCEPPMAASYVVIKF